MADELKINVSATATGDGLRKTAEEVKVLNAETAKSAPLALETKTREEQLAAVRERHAEAARKQAEAEAELDAKRAASPFFNGQQAPLAPAAPPEGGGAGESLLGVGVGGALAGAAAAASAMLAKEAIDGLLNITTRMEEARLETEKMSNALKAQTDIWLEQAQAVRSRGDLLKFQKDVRSEIEATELKMRDLQHSTGSWVDQWKLWADANGEGSVTGEALSFIETKREREIALLREKAAVLKAGSGPEIALSQKLLRELEAIEKLPVEGKLAALGEMMMEMQVRQGGFLKDSLGWNEWAVRMEEVEKRTAAVTAEIERTAEARAKEGEQLDATMRKEGEKFTQGQEQRHREGMEIEANMHREAVKFQRAEEARQREGEQLDANMRKEGEKFLAAEAKTREQEQRERQKEADRAARDRARIDDEESRWRTKHNIPPPGFLNTAPAAVRTLDRGGRMAPLGQPTDFDSIFHGGGSGGSGPALSSAGPANAGLVEAAREVRDTVLAQIRAQAEAVRILAEIKSREGIHS